MNGPVRIVGVLREGGSFQVLEGLIGQPAPVTAAVVLPRRGADVSDALARAFEGAARIAGRLDHPGIPRLLASGWLGPRPYVAFERVVGSSLLDLIDTPSRLPLHVVLTAGSSIAAILRYAHQREPAVAHGDLELDRAIATATGDIKLLGFGLSIAREILRSQREGSAPVSAAGPDGDARAFMTLMLELFDAADARSQDEILRLDARLRERLRSDRVSTTSVLDDVDTTCKRVLERVGAPPVTVPPVTAPDPKARVAALFDFGAGLGAAIPSVAEADPNDPPSEVTSPDAHVLPVVAMAEPVIVRDAEDLTGEEIRGYILGERIGSGTYSDVYRGHHAYLDRVAAIKVMKPAFGKVERARRRALREAAALAKLQHPHVVGVLDCGLLDDSRPFLILELLRGITLSHLIKEGPLPPERIAEIARQIADGLVAIHELGLVHRDLKPSNLMLVGPDAGTVKILDLGVVRRLDDTDETRLTRAGQIVGTPSYMAPEQIRRPSDAGPEADLYAAGAILYAMMTGHPPFAGNAQEVIRQHLAVAPPPLPDSPLSSIVMRLLSKSPESRVKSAADLRAEIDRVRGRTGSSGRRPLAEAAPVTRSSSAGVEIDGDVGMPTSTAPLRSRPTPERKPVFTIALATSAFVVGVGLALVIFSQAGQNSPIAPVEEVAAVVASPRTGPSVEATAPVPPPAEPPVPADPPPVAPPDPPPAAPSEPSGASPSGPSPSPAADVEEAAPSLAGEEPPRPRRPGGSRRRPAPGAEAPSKDPRPSAAEPSPARTPESAAALQKKLGVIFERMKLLRATRSLDEIEVLDKRLLQLRAEIRRAETPEDLAALAEQVRAFDRQVGPDPPRTR